MFKQRNQSPPPPQTNSTSLCNSIYSNVPNGSIFANRYKVERSIGKGSYGKVKLAYDLQNHYSPVALKLIHRSTIKKAVHYARIKRETNLLKALDHPNVLKVLDNFETASEHVLVMEFVKGKDLFDYITKQGKLSENDSKIIFAQLLDALEYLHEHRVVHRDLKPENVMVDEKLQVKLIDFGFATLYNPQDQLSTNCGSPLYAAPEIVRGQQYTGPEVDSWSVGVVLYAMLTGCLPFEGEGLKALYSKICQGDFSIPDHVSQEACDLLKGLICVNTNKRLSISQAKRHPWLPNTPRANTNDSNLMPIIDYRCLDDSILGQLESNFSLVNARDQVRYDKSSPARAFYILLYEQKRNKFNFASPLAISSRQHSGNGIEKNPNEWTVVMDEHIQYQSDMGTPRYKNLYPKQSPLQPQAIGIESEDDDSNDLNLLSDLNSPANFVMQAAATVMNRFKKLKEKI
jgi:serine/threonine protein kinase